MNIKGRINARKILLIYFYEQYFLDNAGKQERLLQDVEKAEKIVRDANDGEEVSLKDIMKAEYYGDFDAEIAYIVEHHFRKFASEDIDREYITTIGEAFPLHKDTVRDKVNEHTVSFEYDDMDMIDRVIFVLGYVEFVTMKTPKEVVLNEMVELAKRYGDDKSSKLINGIGHKVLSSVEE